ncbi:DUF4446 family protein [Nocardioides jiangxiensis]|uniref:DUF4446 family protein n=1 Tax=Nocardioides jiangxiensis TaxID=3064524 RepID=A0ABT9B1Y6_9ACTN|nr:DUF4446 family protein [Nocardioides sp. WY-20]MDO7868319.1 DUF4446 family protein [Nocardioides sp. WY-20]
MNVVAILALLVAVAALVVALLALLRGDRSQTPVGTPHNPLPEDVQGLRQEVAALRAEGGFALKHLAVVRYDAFGDMGGHLSWSLALADDDGNGVVVTSIHGRSEARTYAKSVAGWTCDQPLSPEEDEALAAARG